jgi:hypothetical protein
LRNRIVRTFGLARAAVDAIVCNHRCHEFAPLGFGGIGIEVK